MCGEEGFLPAHLWPPLQHQHTPECQISPGRWDSQTPTINEQFFLAVLEVKISSKSAVSLFAPLAPPGSWYQRKWGHNVSEFRQRFDSELTVGEGPKRLRNLYFLYLIELRALAKVLPFFQQPSFRLYTGRTEDDQKHKELLLEILQLSRSVWKPEPLISRYGLFALTLSFSVLVYFGPLIILRNVKSHAA